MSRTPAKGPGLSELGTHGEWLWGSLSRMATVSVKDMQGHLEVVLGSPQVSGPQACEDEPAP